MDKTTFRILDTLTRDFGTPVSINELKNRIDKTYGSAYYKNIYDKVKDLENEGILNLENVGKSKSISLNFNHKTISLLGEMEKNKLSEIIKNTRFSQFFENVENQTRGLYISISSIKSIKNLSLNRAELLILNFQQEELYTLIKKLESKTSIKIDPLILSRQEFLDILTSKEYNPLKTMLKDQTTIIKPDDFWTTIAEKDTNIFYEEEKELPLSETNLIYNLNRFGYREIGEKIQESEKICLELIIADILISGTSRKKEAIPILLSKNKASYPLLFFLCKKYNKLDVLLGFLRALNKIKSTREVENTIKILENIGTEEKKVDYKPIKEKMDLYGG